MTKTLTYLALAIVSFLLFAFCIPVQTYESAPIFFAILGALACGILLAMSLVRLIPKPEVSEYKEEVRQDNTGCIMAVGIIVFFIGFCWFFIANGNNRREEELKQYGTYTVATISDGSSGGRGSVITLKFLNKKEVKCTANFDITGLDFNKFYKDQQLPIVYSERSPSIIQPLFTEADYAKYTKTKVRPIALKDLQHLFELKGEADITAYLNSVQPEWKYEYLYADSSHAYINEFKNIAIKIKGNEIDYMLDEVNGKVFDEEINAQGFKDVNSEKNNIAGQLKQQRILINDNYILMARNEQMAVEREKSEQDRRREEQNRWAHDIMGQEMRTVTVITLLKAKNPGKQ